MSLQLLPDEREAIAKATAAVERIYSYCNVMLTRGAPLDDLDALYDIHAASACLSIELPELVDTIDGKMPTSTLIDARRRLLLTAGELVDRMESNSTTAARLRVIAMGEEHNG
jgi:hypothetical protein